MGDYKYVMFKCGKTGCQFPIIFPDKLVHADVQHAVETLIPSSMTQTVSAGIVTDLYVAVSDDQRSSTLNLGPRPQDEDVINTLPYLLGLHHD